MQSEVPTNEITNNTTYTPSKASLKLLFGVWDYVVFAILLFVPLAIGIFYGRKSKNQSTNKEFFMAGKSMGVVPVALSLLASFISAITLLSISNEMYIYGTQYWIISFSFVFVISASAFIFVPLFYKLKITSVFEYIERRFSKGIRTYICIVFIAQTVVYLSMALYAPCLALSVVTGLDKWIAVGTLSVVCTIYTAIGGMKAVIWTDVVQITLMFFGLIAIIIKGSLDHGFVNLWTNMYNNERIELWNPNPNPLVRHTFWSIFIGGFFTWLVLYGVNQTQIQRTLCCPTLRKGQLAMLLNIPGLITLMTVCCLVGFVIFSEYHTCDPILLKAIKNKDSLVPFYVMDKMNYPAFPGFFTACIFSGSLSTISSGLNSLAAIFSQEVLFEFWLKDMKEKNIAIAFKLITVIFGIIITLLSIITSFLGGLLEAGLALLGITGGPILGTFILGIFYPWANYKGAYGGLTIGLIISLWLGICNQVYKPPVIGYIPVPTTCDNCTGRSWVNDSVPISYLTSEPNTTKYFNQTSPLAIKCRYMHKDKWIT